ncbi:protein kinase [Coleofasciculus sp. FACHB-T130]|uniref:protein kinase domain-containing protein n=1 Tax=Cyanophyceae TaxID=3028117 RepID=UPI001683BAF1|nr:protein kinase [Coleofasciculus sp. FACHB-T130]MBD1881472.1 protein kinase [Coleofasciculus sp. FACHB-T130]
MNPHLLNNRYRIIQTLGSGGFGNTFLAEDTHMPSRRRCVIKQLKPMANNPQMFQMAQDRFQREAAILEAMGEGSDQIPKLYAYFSEAGQFHLVQELIEGKTLTKKVQTQGLVPESQVKEILVSLLPVLDYIHSKGIIHRDIKPDNIIIRQRDGKPVLIDFGAVKESMGAAVHPGNAPASIVIGTPGFMPPEQGVGQPVFASDIYSLALTAIYLLTGKLPQDLPTDPRTGEILWHQSAANVSPGFVAVLDKAIQSHPRDRYSTSREMLDALQSGATPTVASAGGAGVSNMATVAVSPGGGRNVSPAPVNLPHTPPNPAPVVGQGRRWNPLLIGILGGLTLVGAIVGLTRFFSKSPESPSPVASSSPTSEPTARETERTPERNRPLETSPSPSPDSPTRQDEATPPPVIAESPTPRSERSPEPEPARTPEPAPVQSATPEPARSPEPVRTPEPAPVPQNNNPNPNRPVSSVPTFPVGTSRSTIQASLGTPNRDVSGAWRTRAVVYNLVPNQIDLGYLFDRNSGRLRQTEASFYPTVDPQVVETTLDGLLTGGANNYTKQGLKQVQQRRRSSYTFTQGSLKGMIVRQDCDVIYISIWDADLHEHNPSAARKC